MRGFGFRRKKTDSTAEPKKNKYGNKKVEYDGYKFDSSREKDRYIILRQAEAQGKIKDLRLQVKFEIIPTQYEDEWRTKQLKTKVKEWMQRRVKHRPITYTCDFMYVKTATHETVVEDVKISPRMIPKEFELKEKLMSYFKHIDIRRVYKPAEPI